MAGKRKLHNEPVNISVAVKTVDCREKFLFGHVVLKTQQSGCESAAFAGFYLMGNVGFAAAVVSNEHSGQMRTLAPSATIFSTSSAISALMSSAIFFPSMSIVYRVL